MKNAILVEFQTFCFTIVEEENQIVELHFKKMDINYQNTPLLIEAKKQLLQYLIKKRKKFNLPLNPKGTSFQKSVWAKLLMIPYGQCVTYQTIAIQLGNKNKVRAIGNANNKNPIPIFIPCHRVINKNNKIGGYALGENWKKYFIELENLK